MTHDGIAAARERSAAVDALVHATWTALPGSAAAIALGAYGSRELTPYAEVELLVLHTGALDSRTVTEVISYPLWSRGVRVEPTLATVPECAALVRRSATAAVSLLDARLVAGSQALHQDFERGVLQPLRRDRGSMRKRLLANVQQRRAAHASAASAGAPDLVDGRGGLRDLQVLRWLEQDDDPRVAEALEFLLRVVATLEGLVGHAAQRLSPRVQERLAVGLGYPNASALTYDLYGHARWVAFRLDGAWAPARADRSLGASLEVRGGRLVGERLPPVERAPSLGLRVANLVGLAPPGIGLLGWAARPGPPLTWDTAALDQLWLLLRAGDWRSWDFLDASGLLLRYLPELASISRQRDGSGPRDLTLDSHTFLSLRRLHQVLEADDPVVTRVWASIRHHDWLNLAILVHEAGPDAAAVADRLGLPPEARATLTFLVERQHLLEDTATQRDLHDEDMLLDLAARIGSLPRLRMLFVLSVAHGMAASGTAWTAEQVRRLFLVLERTMRQPRGVSRRRSRSIEQHRERVAEQLRHRHLDALLPMVPRLPRRYLLSRSPAFIARHLELAGGAPLGDGEVRLHAKRQRQPGVWDVLIAARDRPGLLSTMAGVLALRGASVLAADAATCSDGLVLDVFTVSSAYGVPLEAALWPRVQADLRAALDGRLPLEDLLATPSEPPEDDTAVGVSVDNAASEVFSVIEVRAADRVGLLYRIARGLHDLGLDIHHARIATHAQLAQDVFYVWDLEGEKLTEPRASHAAERLAARLRGRPS